jgi:hypothetical protein
MLMWSFWLYWSFVGRQPYYNKQIQLLYNFFSASYLWTNLMLLISYFLANTSFDGGMIIWLMGLPFIAFIMFSAKRSHINKLLKSQVKFRSGGEVLDHIRYVLQLIDD